jgi:hypothetical protein
MVIGRSAIQVHNGTVAMIRMKPQVAGAKRSVANVVRGQDRKTLPAIPKAMTPDKISSNGGGLCVAHK